MAILGLRCSEYQILTELVDFDVTSKLLGIRYPLARVTRVFWTYRRGSNPQRVAKGENTLGVGVDDIALRQFFFYYINRQQLVGLDSLVIVSVRISALKSYCIMLCMTLCMT